MGPRRAADRVKKILYKKNHSKTLGFNNEIYRGAIKSGRSDISAYNMEADRRVDG